MADEEKTQDGDSTATEESTFTKEEYKAMQARLQDTEKQLTEKTETLELVSPYIDYDKVPGQAPGREPEPTEEPETVTKADLQKVKDSNKVEMLILRMQVDNPDLKEYSDLVRQNLLDIANSKIPVTADKALEKAVAKTREFLDTERAKGVKAAEEKRQKDAAAGGLGSAGNTAPAEVPEGQTNEEYVAERRKRVHSKL
jgi:hypothetical protein